MREKFIKRKSSIHLNVLTVSNIMNKYESSGLGKYKLNYATNAMKQRALQSRKGYNPLYPAGEEDSANPEDGQRDEQRLQEDQGLAAGQELQENPGPQDEQSGVDQEQPDPGNKNL